MQDLEFVHLRIFMKSDNFFWLFSLGGVVLVQLLDWLKWHFTQGDFTAREVMSEDEPEKHEQYWDAVSIGKRG